MSNFFHEIQQLMDAGGFVLWIMLVLSAILYTILTTAWLGMLQVKSEINKLQQDLDSLPTAELIRDRIELFELDRLAWVQRRLPVLSVLIALAPLAGLLGTVSGILKTFAGLASKATTKPIDSISSGISEALITTQAGLLIAIPAAILYALLRGQSERLSGQLEQSSTQQVVTLATAS